MIPKLIRLICRLRGHRWGPVWYTRSDDSMVNTCNRCLGVRIADPEVGCWRIRPEVYPFNRVPFPRDVERFPR